MTIGTENNRNQYTGNDVTTSFPYTFKIFDKTHVKVILLTPAGAEIIQVVDLDYSVTDVGNSAGGTIEFSVAPATNSTITIIRNQPETQELNFIQNDPFPADDMEIALDKLTMQSQERREEYDRALKFKASEVSSVESNLPILTGQAGRFVRVNNTEDGFEYATQESSLPGSAGFADDLNGVSNAGGTVNLISSDNSVIITPDDGLNQIDMVVPAVGAGVFNVVQYGATGNGVTDDSTAIANAVTALNANGGGVLLFPAGTYIVSQTFNLTATATISGNGIQNTKIIKTNATGIFTLTGGASEGNARIHFKVRNMSLLTRVAGGGTAIAATYALTGGFKDKYICVENVEFTGDAVTEYWNKGIVFTDVRNTKIIGCDFKGKFTLGDGDFLAGSIAIEYASAGTQVQAGHIINECLFSNWDIAVENDVGSDVHFDNSTIKACNVGIDWTGTAATRNGFFVDNSFIRPFTVGIRTSNCQYGTIQNTLIFQDPDGTVTTTGIQLNTNSKDITIADCVVADSAANGNDTNGIVLANNNNIEKNIIQGVKFDGCLTAITVNSNASTTRLLDNIFFNCGTDITDTSSDSITELIGGGLKFRGAIVYKTVNQNIPDSATPTKVTWSSSALIDTDGLYNNGQNTFDIPAGFSGKAQLSTNVRWEHSTTGFRGINIQKGNSVPGTGFIGSGGDTRNAMSSALGTPAINTQTQTSVIPVSGGEQFMVVARQQGVSPNTAIQAGSAPGRPTWFMIELVEED